MRHIERNLIELNEYARKFTAIYTINTANKTVSTEHSIALKDAQNTFLFQNALSIILLPKQNHLIIQF